MITLDKLQVSECPISDIRDFVQRHHYSKSVKGITPTQCFRVDHEGVLVGAAIFGIPAMREAIRKYSEDGKVKMVELRRLCFVDEAPRNSESMTLARMFRHLKKSDVQRILSYSDPNYGHVGTIYKAIGFRLLGQTPPIRVIWYRDRKWSTRSINRYKSWQDKSKGLRSSTEELRTALESGDAVLRTERGKFIYLLDLRIRAGKTRKSSGSSRTSTRDLDAEQVKKLAGLVETKDSVAA